MNKSDLVVVRDAVVEDKNFVYSTFLRGLYYGNDWFNCIDKNVFMANYQRLLEALLALPGVVVKVACLKDDPEVILGYSIYQGNRLDWVFVKKAWRSIGIARSLVPTTTDTVTHLTVAGRGILKKHTSVKYNPFALGQT